jgi:hypothetical protein
MQLSMLDGLDLYSLRRVLPSDADHVAHSRPRVNTRPNVAVAIAASAVLRRNFTIRRRLDLIMLVGPSTPL